MLVPVNQKLLPTLGVAALPLAAVVVGVVAFTWWAGGAAGLERVVSAAGPSVLVGVVAGVALMLVASALLVVEALGRRLPLLLVVMPALLPWLLGMTGAKGTVERLVETLPPVVGEESLPVLARGLGEGLVSRLVGTGLSAALLVGVAVGLLLVRRAPVGGSPRRPGQRLDTVLSLVLGGVGLVVVLEVHQLFELLTALPHTGPAQRGALLAASTARLSALHTLHLSALGLLALLALAQVAWELRSGPRQGSQWPARLALAGVVAVVMGLDVQPLAPSEQGVQVTRLLRSLLPDSQALPLDPLGLSQEPHGSTSPPESRTLL